MTARAMASEPEGQACSSEALLPRWLPYRENRELASELKFQVEVSLADRICEWARYRLSPDPNAQAGEREDDYYLSSLYFDTEQLDVFRRNGSFGRSKYRVRRYGQSPTAFLERKLKTRGLVCKRRSPVRIDELKRLVEAEPVSDWIGFWYHQRLVLRRLQPICQIAYHRTARMGANGHGPIRLTVDQGIRAQPAQGLSFADPAGGQLVSDGYAIVELKYRSEMPILFKELVEQFALNPKRISKYRVALVGLGLASGPVGEEARQAP
jgi:hypothetical protein